MSSRCGQPLGDKYHTGERGEPGDLASPPELLCGWLSCGAKGKSLDVPKL